MPLDWSNDQHAGVLYSKLTAEETGSCGRPSNQYSCQCSRCRICLSELEHVLEPHGDSDESADNSSCSNSGNDEATSMTSQCGPGRRMGCYVRLCALVTFVGLYLVLGATVFSVLEMPGEVAWKDRLRSLHSSFLANNTCVTEDELESIVKHILFANNHGITVPTSAADTYNSSFFSNWNFGQSFFFVGTLLTTVGYGHVTPLSTEGKVFCIIYAAVGIPLTLIMLKAVAEAVMVPLGDAMGAVERRLKAASCCSLACRLLPVLSVVALLVSLIFFVPAAVFCSLEPEWSFLDAFYFCFISIATIGLGDYIPGSSPNQQPAAFYKACTVAYLYIGLLLMMLLLSSVRLLPELQNLERHFYVISGGFSGSISSDEQKKLLTAAAAEHVLYTRQDNEMSQCSTRSNSYAKPSSPCDHMHSHLNVGK